MRQSQCENEEQNLGLVSSSSALPQTKETFAVPFLIAFAFASSTASGTSSTPTTSKRRAHANGSAEPNRRDRIPCRDHGASLERKKEQTVQKIINDSNVYTIYPNTS